MKPASFEYHRPDTAAEAVTLLAEHGDEAKVLAGGQSLVPMLALRLTVFEHLVDISRVAELEGIERRGDSLWIGSGTTEAAVERSPLVAETVPLLARATPYIGHFQIRNRGTLGGSLAHADPAAELPAVAVALDAAIEARSVRGSRRIPAGDFFVSAFTTVLEPEELVTAVHMPVWGAGSGFAVAELTRRHGDFAIAGAACGVQVAGGRIARAAVALFGMGSVPVRAWSAEQALAGALAAEADLTAIGGEAVAALEPPSDAHGSAAYRRRVGAHMVTRALRAALAEAQGDPS
jgi:carbon-monoxide dehydrogenase medium subunit